MVRVRGWLTLVALAVVVLGVVVAACGSGDAETASSGDTAERSSYQEATEEAFVDESTSDGAAFDEASDDGGFGAEATEEATEEPVEEESLDGAGEESTGGASVGSGVTVPTNLQPGDLGRDIIRTATATVEVEDVATAAREAILAIDALGGFVSDQLTTEDPRVRAVLTFKVLPEDFDEARARLSDLGRLRDEVVTSEDVTDRIVDLESRIATAEVSVARLREFLTDAPSVEAVAQLEQQLLQRETDLEQLRGALRTVSDRVAQATIVLTIVEREVELPEAEITLLRAVLDTEDTDACVAVDRDTESGEFAEGDEAVACYVVTNGGEATLDDLVLEDQSLAIDLDDLIVVAGSLDEPLAPDSLVVLAYPATLRRDLRGSVGVSAVAVDEFGDPVGDPIFDEVSGGLAVDADDSLPGFGDAFGSSVDALRWLGGVALIVIAAIVPFLWVPLLAAALWWWLRRRRNRPAVLPPPPPPPPLLPS